MLQNRAYPLLRRIQPQDLLEGFERRRQRKGDVRKKISDETRLDVKTSRSTNVKAVQKSKDVFRLIHISTDPYIVPAYANASTHPCIIP